MHARSRNLAVDRIGAVAIDGLAVAPRRSTGIPHRGEQSRLRIEERAGIEELGELVGSQPLPATGEGLQIDIVSGEDHLHLEKKAAFLEVDFGVQVGRVRFALRSLHRDVAAGETTDAHLKVKALQVEHPLARLLEKRGAVRWRSPARRDADDDCQAGRKGAKRQGAGMHQSLRIRSSPTRRVIFWASSHSSKGRTYRRLDPSTSRAAATVRVRCSVRCVRSRLTAASYAERAKTVSSLTRTTRFWSP